MKVVVELIAARFAGDDLRFTVRRAVCPKRGDPTVTARAELAVAFPALWLHGILVHSTSWRYEDESVVLTHIAVADDLPIAELPLLLPLDRVNEERGDGVAGTTAHAIRHLAFLVRDDPRAFADHFGRDTLARLAAVAPDIAGRLRVRAA